MKLTLELNMDGAAFDGDAGPAEAARLLRETAVMVAEGWDSGFLRDVNGNRVGGWSVAAE